MKDHSEGEGVGVGAANSVCFYKHREKADEAKC